MYTAIEKEIINYLVLHGINPFSVLYSGISCFLKISFYLDQEIQEFKDLLGFKSLCDKSGYTEFLENNTIILSGMLLSRFIKIMSDETNR